MLLINIAVVTTCFTYRPHGLRYVEVALYTSMTSAHSLAPPVLCLHKWHWCEGRLPQLVADIHVELCALLVPPRLDVAHRDVLAERWRRNAGCHDT